MSSTRWCGSACKKATGIIDTTSCIQLFLCEKHHDGIPAEMARIPVAQCGPLHTRVVSIAASSVGSKQFDRVIDGVKRGATDLALGCRGMVGEVRDAPRLSPSKLEAFHAHA